MPFAFDFRQIAIDLSASNPELLGQVIDRHGSTGQSPHHSSETVGLAVGFGLAPFLLSSRLHAFHYSDSMPHPDGTDG
jgi:hypothetical protein